MKSLLSASLAFLAATTLAPAAIVLVDSSFESNDLANGGAQLNGAGVWPSGGTWPGSSTYLVDNGVSQNTYFAEAVPGGQQALSLANGFISQQLNDDVNGAVMTGTTAQQFNISFYAARRLGATGSGSGTFSVLLQAYNGNAFVGTLASQLFNLTSDASSSTIDLGLGVGEWSDQLNFSLTAPANLMAGNNIRLVFAANGGANGDGLGNFETAIDNVAIALVPEPSVALLGGLGLLGLLRRRRR